MTILPLIWFVVAGAVMLGAVWLAERPGNVTANGTAGGSTPASAWCWSACCC